MGVIMGTAAYMSPEQARGKPVDKRADIWAFGAVLYEILTGHQPFGGPDVADTLAAIVRAEPEWNEIPPRVGFDLRRLLRTVVKIKLPTSMVDVLLAHAAQPGAGGHVGGQVCGGGTGAGRAQSPRLGGDRVARHRVWGRRGGLGGDGPGTRHHSEGRQELVRGGPSPARIRRPGAGRPNQRTDADLRAALEVLVDPLTRGDPTSPLRWTCKSRAKLAATLAEQGWAVSSTTVGRMLKDLGYRLQAPRKRFEGAAHPDRNEQFEFINATADGFLQRAQPVISVDTKKKELVGNFRNGGREWQPRGTPEQVLVHDFPGDSCGKAIPYGVYDMARNEAWVSVGRDHDTPAFAVASIRHWWRKMGRRVYPKATDLFITADAGGSNGYRSRAWKLELQTLADQTRLRVHVSHFPPGTSKWNKIEHRLFCHITENWRGTALRTFETIVDRIGNTRTAAGLRVRAQLDRGRYPTGVKVSKSQMDRLALQPEAFRGEWNYTLLPR